MYIINRDGLSNYHTHSTYCDGKDTPEEMVQRALELGFTALGFSGHSYVEFDKESCMSPDGTKAYRDEILRLKDKYSGQIDIKLGLERDHYSEDDGYDYDFVIGANHYLKLDDGFYAVDDTEEIVNDTVERKFGGSWERYYECYYSQEANLLRDMDCDIIAHFDLVMKFNEGSREFDENNENYRQAALYAIDELVSTNPFKKPVFEVNTGAMAKGYRTAPYPSLPLLAEIDRLGCNVIISSDCHDKRYLNYAFDEVLADLSQW